MPLQGLCFAGWLAPAYMGQCQKLRLQQQLDWRIGRATLERRSCEQHNNEKAQYLDEDRKIYIGGAIMEQHNNEEA